MIRSARAGGAVLIATAGLLWIFALFVPLTSYGTGSIQPSHELADLALSGVADTSVSRWTGLLWYGTGLVGCLVLAGCTTSHWSVSSVRLFAGTAATILAAYAGLNLGGSVSDGFGPAVWMSLVAWVLCAGGTYLAWLGTTRRARSAPLPQPPAPSRTAREQDLAR